MTNAIVVGVSRLPGHEWEVRDCLDELTQLSETAGYKVVHRQIFKQPTISPAYFIGKGKAETIAELVLRLECQLVVFDDDLSPAQSRNLENLIGVAVTDRTKIILDIFAMHARSKPGRLQVELARLEYELPRLRHRWSHLERQKGGIGMRSGPGEQQMEVDRRRIQEKIVRLQEEIDVIKRRREELRRTRRREGWALVTLVGYTNAGKSTLLNSLTGANVLTKNQLFVTLDPTTRLVELPNQQPVLVTDTVGFIRKLPHNLVDAFHATLEEVVQADLLVHVIDSAHPRVHEQIMAVNGVLRELNVQHKPIVMVLNKVDLAEGEQQVSGLSRELGNCVAVSALKGVGLEKFCDMLADNLRDRRVNMCLRIPLAEAKLIANLRGAAKIHKERYDKDSAYFEAGVSKETEGLYARYVIPCEEI